jgi:glycosyltransferase involved in cell wall biosynthesis
MRYLIAMAQPFISVIINNYNYAQFVGTAIESALAQTYPHREIIVVDDGSTDESREVIQRYADRVQVVFKENGGQASAFHAGVAAARGEVICFLDSDDYWAPQLLERVAARWDDSLAMVEWRMECVDPDGKPLGRSFPIHTPYEGDLRPILTRRIYYPSTPTSGNAFARRAVEAVFPLDESFWRISADAPLLMGAPFYGKFAFIDETLSFYRVHGGNLYYGIPPRWERLQREVRHLLAREPDYSRARRASGTARASATGLLAAHAESRSADALAGTARNPRNAPRYACATHLLRHPRGVGVRRAVELSAAAKLDAAVFAGDGEPDAKLYTRRRA